MFFSYFSIKNLCYGYSLEVPRQCTSNEYPQYMFFVGNKKNNSTFCLKKKNTISGAMHSQPFLLRACTVYHSICSVRNLDTLGRFSVIFHKRDNFCYFLLAFQLPIPI